MMLNLKSQDGPPFPSTLSLSCAGFLFCWFCGSSQPTHSETNIFHLNPFAVLCQLRVTDHSFLYLINKNYLHGLLLSRPSYNHSLSSHMNYTLGNRKLILRNINCLKQRAQLLFDEAGKLPMNSPQCHICFTGAQQHSRGRRVGEWGRSGELCGRHLTENR